MLRDLRGDLGISLIFISHDLSVVRVLCERVLVLAHGSVVEAGATAEIFAAPRAAYTRALLDAVPLPIVDPGWIERVSVDEADPQDDRGGPGMKIAGCTALVTGANRGIGTAYVAALLAGGARKVYATARRVDALADLAKAHPGKVEVLALDITDAAAVAAAARRCGDVSLLINNAGINQLRGLLAAPDLAAARAEMEANYFGTLAMCRAFAPGVERQWRRHHRQHAVDPGAGKPAADGLALRLQGGRPVLTQAVRAEFAEQGTHVIAVMPGAVDTDMTRGFQAPKMPPAEVRPRRSRARAWRRGGLSGRHGRRRAQAWPPTPRRWKSNSQDICRGNSSVACAVDPRTGDAYCPRSSPRARSSAGRALDF